MKRLLSAAVLLASVVGCVPKSTAPTAPETKDVGPLQNPRIAAAQEAAAEINENTKKVEDSLAKMRQRLSALEADRFSTSKLDHTFVAFREANKKLWEMNRELLAIHDVEFRRPLDVLKKQLKEAPNKFLLAGGQFYDRAMAADDADVRAEYLKMATVAWAGKSNCEERYKRLFEPPAPGRINATNIEAAITKVRKFERVHAAWDELCLIHIELSDNRLDELFGKMGEYADALVEFRSLTERFAEAVKVDDVSLGYPKTEGTK